MHYITQMYAATRALVMDKKGATAVEYSLLAALISLAVIAGATLAGPQIDRIFRAIATALTAAK